MTLTEVAMEEIIRQVSIHNNESEYRYFLIKRKRTERMWGKPQKRRSAVFRIGNYSTFLYRNLYI